MKGPKKQFHVKSHETASVRKRLTSFRVPTTKISFVQNKQLLNGYFGSIMNYIVREFHEKMWQGQKTCKTTH